MGCGEVSCPLGSSMFCLDYAFAFGAHSTILYFIPGLTHPTTTFGLGASAGLVAAVALYPFDFVRMSTVPKGSSHFAFGTIPFMSCYLGLYFWQHPTNRTSNLSDSLCWASLSTAVGSLAELPFDQAKIGMAGGVRGAALAAAMRVPLGSLLLVGYDQIVRSMLRSRDPGGYEGLKYAPVRND